MGRVRDRPVTLLQTSERDLQHIFTSQVVPAVRQVKTLVAQGKVGNLLVAECQCQSVPVVEGRVDDLIASKSALVVRPRHMADLASPAFDKTDDQMVGLRGLHIRPDWPVRKFLQLAANES